MEDVLTPIHGITAIAVIIREAYKITPGFDLTLLHLPDNVAALQFAKIWKRNFPGTGK